MAEVKDDLSSSLYLPKTQKITLLLKKRFGFWGFFFGLTKHLAAFAPGRINARDLLGAKQRGEVN